MAITVKVAPGEALKVFPSAHCDLQLRYGGMKPGTPLATATADSKGDAVVTGLPPRQQCMAQRADGRLIAVMEPKPV